MKKWISWLFWIICVVLVVFSLIKMFMGTEYWVFYALIVAIGFYLTKKIFNKHLLR